MFGLTFGLENKLKKSDLKDDFYNTLKIVKKQGLSPSEKGFISDAYLKIFDSETSYAEVEPLAKVPEVLHCYLQNCVINTKKVAMKKETTGKSYDIGLIDTVKDRELLANTGSFKMSCEPDDVIVVRDFYAEDVYIDSIEERPDLNFNLLSQKEIDLINEKVIIIEKASLKGLLGKAIKGNRYATLKLKDLNSKHDIEDCIRSMVYYKSLEEEGFELIENIG
jgi:hypothetical protein